MAMIWPGQRAFQARRATYRKLVAYDKHGIGLAANSDPSVLLHLLEDDFLQTAVVVHKVLPAAPEDRVPAECQASFFLEFVITEKHSIQARHQQ